MRFASNPRSNPRSAPRSCPARSPLDAPLGPPLDAPLGPPLEPPLEPPPGPPLDAPLDARLEPPLASFDVTLSRMSVGQHGVLALAQLCRLGLTPAAVRARAAAGRLHRVHHGVYSLAPPELLSRNGRFIAATLACGPGAALSHRSAGALLELIRWNARTVDVSVPTAGGRSRRDGLRVHRVTTLRPDDIADVHGIPCTTVARTLLDLAEQLDRRGLERAIDQAAVTEQFDLNRLREQIAHNRGRPAAALLEAVLAEHVAGSTPTWNELEERMLAVSRSIGVPDPEVQQWLDLGDGEPDDPRRLRLARRACDRRDRRVRDARYPHSLRRRSPA